jgi:hypothetical protein
MFVSNSSVRFPPVIVIHVHLLVFFYLLGVGHPHMVRLIQPPVKWKALIIRWVLFKDKLADCYVQSVFISPVPLSPAFGWVPSSPFEFVWHNIGLFMLVK